MNRKLTSKRNRAEVECLQQPQMDRAATQTTRGECSSGGAELQLKMKEAAKEFVSLAQALWDALDDPNTEDLAGRIESYRIFGPHVYCTPVAVLFRLHEEWIQLTRENVKEAFEILSEWYTIGSRATALADEHLALARTVCKKRGRVSWVLPRINKERGLA